MRRIVTAALIATLLGWEAHAAQLSTVNPNVPAANSPLTSAPIRGNFAAAYNDINTLFSIVSQSSGSTPPANPVDYQSWLDTSASPLIVFKTWDKTTWVPTGVLNNSSHFFSLNVLNPPHGSVWSDTSPFTTYPIFRVRDRLCVDDGCLIPTNLNGGNVAMPNVRAATAINAAGSNWQQPPIRSSIFALSSVSGIAISGMTTTSLNPAPLETQASQSGIAVIGMALADHPTIALPAWGFYGECARITTLGFCFTTELEIGNTKSVVPLNIYGSEPAGRTIGIHLYSGGALDTGTHTYNPASAAMDIGNNGSTFDAGFVFRFNGLSDQGGGVYNAIKFAGSHRLSWYRNNSDTDQLQAYITAKNTTVGAAVQNIEFGTSDRMTLTAALVRTAGAHEIISGASGAVSSLGVGRTASEGGLIVPASINQVFTGTNPGDFIVEANTVLWLAANNGVMAVPGVKIAATGLLTFPQYGSGILQSGASGVVSSSQNLPTGIAVLSGASGTVSTFGIGRTATEGGLGAIATSDQVFTGTVAGDIALEANTNLWLGANVGGTAKAGIKIATTGLMTFPQYGAGVLQSSASGVITSSAISPSSFALTNGHIYVGNGSGVAADVAMSGDATLANTGALTLASTITAGGPTGGATSIPVITYDAKGRLTTVTTITPTVASVNGVSYPASFTSGGIPYASSTGTIASSALLATNQIVLGGGAGTAPATTATGSGVVTALGINVGSTGAFVVNGGPLGTPSGGTVTNLTGTASININGTVGATTPTTGAFTTLSVSTSIATGAVVLSGASGTFSAFSLGRTAAEGSIGIAASADQFAIGAVAGDFGIQAQTNLWLAANGSGTVKSGIKIATTGLLTFPQYTAGVLQASAAGVISSAAISPGSLSLANTHIFVGNGSGVAVDVAMSGDATISNTGVLTLATAQPAIHTWALAQTFTVAPVFTDTSGSRTALGLGTMATQAASAVSISGGTIGSAVTINGATYPTIAQGDILYGSAANTVSALAKNTTATRYLSNTGTTNNPAWSQIDLPTGVTGLLPAANMTLTQMTRQVFKSGTVATYTRPTSPTPIQIRVRMVGGGGGGGGSGTGVSGGAGTDGTNTTFSSFTANRGSGAAAGGASAGAGGAAAATSGSTWGLAGGIGGGAQQGVAGTIVQGGIGGSSSFFGGGTVGNTATANTGAGGTGGPAIGAVISGAGGGAGAGIEFVINSPTTTYTYTVGTGGTFGAGGTSGNGGLAGADGIIVVDEFYQ